MQVSLSKRNMALAAGDLRDGLSKVPVWGMLGWQEIRQRYRGSTLGPFWLTISTGAMIAGMGPLYGRLFNQDISSYFPYMAVSFVIWQLVAGLVNELCAAFISAESIIKQIKLPFSVYVLRLVWKNLIIFAHNFLIILVVLLIFPPSLQWSVVLLPVSLLLLAINAFWVGLLLGMLCARFRDIPQIVGSIVQIAFFLTPVMWHADMLGGYRFIALMNPFYHFLEIVRAPLLGQAVASSTWIAVILMSIVGSALTFLFFSRFRARIPYWV